MTRQGVALTIGTFDGLHRGHQAIFKTLLRWAKRIHRPAMVLTFPKSPRYFFHPALPVELLTTLEEKLTLIRDSGLPRINVLTFDRRFANQTPEAFFENVLIKRYHAKVIVVGENFAFGKNQRGNVQTLKRLAGSYGVRLIVVPRVRRKGTAISSSRIRELLAKGQIRLANDLLGYRYFLRGRVVQGAQRGKSLGYPTANLTVAKEKLLPKGVFAAKVRWGKKQANALCNIGVRPTFTKHGQVVAEAHLLAKTGALYGKTLTLEFLEFLRPEKRFPSRDALVRQIHKDKTYFKRRT